MRGSRIAECLLLTGLLACSGGGGGTGPHFTGTSQASVSVVEFAFSPATVTIKVGQTVAWTNNGQVAHNVTADDGSWSSGLLNGATNSGGYGTGSGGSYGHTFNTAGTFGYHCSVHPPSMYPNFVGSVIVTP